jgi:hypothetical protein
MPNNAMFAAYGRFGKIFKAQTADAQVSYPLVTNAVLAALAREHGATLYSPTVISVVSGTKTA